MTSTAPENRPDWALWSDVLDWQPFKVDALGLITLLGAEEVNAAVGRLVSSRFLEYLPLLGTYVIAGDQFRDNENGWNLYNLTAGIHTTAISAWLTRWTKSQDFERTRSYVVWTVTKPRYRKFDEVVAFVIGFAVHGFLLALTLLTYDWYGFANAVSMVLQVIVRLYVVGANRDSIDRHIEQVTAKSKPSVDETPTYEEAMKDYVKRKRAAGAAKFTEAPPNPIDFGWHNDLVKCLILTADSRAVTMMIPKLLIMPPSVFTFNPEPQHEHRYRAMRMVGWLAFGVQIIAIGMADLATQLYTIALMVIPTILLLNKFGCDDSRWFTNIRRLLRGKSSPSTFGDNEQRSDDQFIPISTSWIGRRLKAEVYEWPLSYEFVTHDANGKPLPRSEKRQHLDAWLQLTGEEEMSMDKWDLIPHMRSHNTKWLDDYRSMKEIIRAKGGGPYSGPVKFYPTISNIAALQDGPAQTSSKPATVSTTSEKHVPTNQDSSHTRQPLEVIYSQTELPHQSTTDTPIEPANRLLSETDVMVDSPIQFRSPTEIISQIPISRPGRRDTDPQITIEIPSRASTDPSQYPTGHSTVTHRTGSRKGSLFENSAFPMISYQMADEERRSATTGEYEIPI